MVADRRSKALAVACCIQIALFLGMAAYYASFAKSEIDASNFSISRALQYGERPAMIVLLAAALATLAWLTIYRDHGYAHCRIALAVAVGLLLVAMIWVTADADGTAHYILAGVLFVLLCAGIVWDNHLVFGPRSGKYPVYILVGGALCAGGVVGILDGVIAMRETRQLLYALENVAVAIKLVSILTLGFA